MMAKKRKSWNAQIHSIEMKGFRAFEDGMSTSDNPYEGGYSNQNGPGGQLQRLRGQAWVRGWLLAQEQEYERSAGRRTDTP